MVNFSVLPPEINSGRMFFGAGSGPMLAAAAAWDGLAAELGLAAESFGLVTSGLAGGSGQAWRGAAISGRRTGRVSPRGAGLVWSDPIAQEFVTLVHKLLR